MKAEHPTVPSVPDESPADGAPNALDAVAVRRGSETDVRAFLGTVAVRVHDDGDSIVVRGESGARDVPVPGIEPRDAFGGFELRLDSWDRLRAVTTRTTTPARPPVPPVPSMPPVPPAPPACGVPRGCATSPVLSNEPAEFSSSVATDGGGRLVQILAERGGRVLGMTSSLDTLDALLLGSPRARLTQYVRSELAEDGMVRTVWDADGPTAIPAGDFLRWRGRLLATPGWDYRTTGSMPPQLAVIDGRTNLLLQAPADLAAVLEGDVRSVTQNVVSVPRSECSGPVSTRTTASWNGRRVEIARSYLVWRDRGRAVITGDGARPDSRSLRTPPLQFLPATDGRWTASVAVTDLDEIVVSRGS